MWQIIRIFAWVTLAQTALHKKYRRFVGASIDQATIAAVWGVESDYGRSFGARPVVQSLATLSCGGTRQAYFRSEFIAALKIIQHGDIAPEQFVGSWAGAFGHTQFMPSTFLRIAVDRSPNVIKPASRIGCV